jgi:lipid A 3-O-deacylase
MIRGLVLSGVFAFAACGAEAVSADPLRGWELDYETGILWRFTGSATPLDYVVLPQILSLKSPAIFTLPLAGGDLALRSRYSFLAEPIVQGPEHHYFGLTGSGILEWWDRLRRRELFISSGGGFGELDSHGYEIAGAQGQEFNLTWFIYGGARWQCSARGSLAIGVYFQHLSNGHLDKVDPGLNALGPMLSAGWRF